MVSGRLGVVGAHVLNLVVKDLAKGAGHVIILLRRMADFLVKGTTHR